MSDYYQSEFYGEDLERAFGIILSGNIELADQRAKEAAKSAAAAKVSETAAGESAVDAERSRQAVENLGVDGATLPAGAQVAVEKLVAEDGTVTLKFSIPQGIQGIQGETGPQGVSITSVERTGGTGAAGTTDTYTVTLSDGSTSTFQVYNGRDGEGAGDMVSAVYDPTGKAHDIYAYTDAAGQAAKDASRPVSWTPTASDVGAIPTSEKGQPNGVATLDGTGKVPGAQIPGGLADEAVEAHNTSTDPHANMHFFRAVDGELTDPLPVDADTLEGASKATIIADAVAQAGAAGLHLFGPVTVNVPLAGWTGAGPWVQTVSVAGVTAADNGLGIGATYIADKAARDAYQKAYGCLAAGADAAETVNGGIVLTCPESKPEISFKVIVKGVR